MMTGFNTIFLDTPFFIYLLEDHPVFGAKAALLLDDGQKKGIGFVTSVITRMEFCVKPYEANQTVVIDHFLNLLNDLDIIQYDINSDIADMAARLRGSYGIKAMDAIQLAVCQYSGCDAFLTNDRKLSAKVLNQHFILLSEYSS